jgi:two-component system, chemotaxis family, sensor kinase CheA
MLVEASPIGPAVLDQVTVRRADVKKLLELAQGRSDELGRVAIRIASRPFGEALFGLVEAAPRWALRESKRVVIEVDGREILVPSALADVLPGVLMHLVRNAIAHGIESVSERTMAGKPDIGVVHLTCIEGPVGPEIIVEDDGRGLDADAVRSHALRLGLDTKVDVARLVFAQGLSTAHDTGLAGRGVGLGAVESDLARVGYTLSLVSSATGLRVCMGPAASSDPAEANSPLPARDMAVKAREAV